MEPTSAPRTASQTPAVNNAAHLDFHGTMITNTAPGRLDIIYQPCTPTEAPVNGFHRTAKPKACSGYITTLQTRKKNIGSSSSLVSF